MSKNGGEHSLTLWLYWRSNLGNGVPELSGINKPIGSCCTERSLNFKQRKIFLNIFSSFEATSVIPQPCWNKPICWCHSIMNRVHWCSIACMCISLNLHNADIVNFIASLNLPNAVFHRVPCQIHILEEILSFIPLLIQFPLFTDIFGLIVNNGLGYTHQLRFTITGTFTYNMNKKSLYFDFLELYFTTSNLSTTAHKLQIPQRWICWLNIWRFSFLLKKFNTRCKIIELNSCQALFSPQFLSILLVLFQPFSCIFPQKNILLKIVSIVFL